jgi:hypothetical protein
MKTLPKALFLLSVSLAFAAPVEARDKPKAQADPPIDRHLYRLSETHGRFDDRAPTTALIPLTDDLDVGVGMFSVGGHFARDRGGRSREPIVGPRGSQSRVAAVGLSLHF